MGCGLRLFRDPRGRRRAGGNEEQLYEQHDGNKRPQRGEPRYGPFPWFLSCKWNPRRGRGQQMIKVLRTQGGVVRLEQWKEEDRGQVALAEQCAVPTADSAGLEIATKRQGNRWPPW